jgi:hypothetical protein
LIKHDKSTDFKLRMLGMGLLCLCLIFAFQVIFTHAQDYAVLNGDWVRPDGGYLLRVSHARADGSVEAAYFNPTPIHVSEASVSTWKDLKKLFVKLQGKGYPGSTYTLYYFEEKDALAGFYFQAQTGQTFEVIFVRNSPSN